MFFKSLLGLVLTVSSSLSFVEAGGAGTNVMACYYISTPPFTPIAVAFTVAAVQCMDDVGNDASLIVTDAGVTCVSVGYVEGKGGDTGGDNCAVNPSTWSLAYKTNSTGTSGSTEAVLTYHLVSSDTFELQNQSPGTAACDQQAMCSSTTYSWSSGVGQAYVIFNPAATSAFHEVGGSANQQIIQLPHIQEL